MSRPTTRGATLGKSTQRASLQAKSGKQDQDAEPYATRYNCATHQVAYYVSAGRRETCPVCTLEAKLEHSAGMLHRLEDEVHSLRANYQKALEQIDLNTAMAAAVEMLDDRDTEWIKTQLYQFKIDKSVVLKVTHGAPMGRRSKRSDMNKANGFIAIPRRGDPVAHSCSSMGGLALASYFDEAATTVGASQAMVMMTKALWRFLPGAKP